MFARDSLTSQYFDDGSVTVNDHTEGEAFLAWFEQDTRSVARLAGAPTGSIVDIHEIENTFRIDVTGPYIEGTMVRVIRQAERFSEPHLYIRNSGFALPAPLRRKKLGIRSVAIELFEAARTGAFHCVEVDAIGNSQTLSPADPAHQYSGYLVWPQLGFDGPIPQDAIDRHPELAAFSSVRDVLTRDNGRTWAHKGSSALLKFDLHPESPGWAALTTYMADNAIEVRR